MSTVSPCFMFAPLWRDQLPVGGGVDQPGGGGLLPGEVAGLGHQLVALDQGELGQAAEVGLEAPDALLGVHHRVVVPGRVLQLHRQAVRDHLVAGLPLVHPRPDAQHDAGQVRADHVIGQVVLLGQLGDPAVALQEAEGGDGLEDRRPHGVVVHRGGHHRHDRLARAQLGGGHLLHVQRLARVLLPGGHAGEHVLLVLAHQHRPVGLRHGQAPHGGQLIAEDGVPDLVHAVSRVFVGTEGCGVGRCYRRVTPPSSRVSGCCRPAGRARRGRRRRPWGG